MAVHNTTFIQAFFTSFINWYAWSRENCFLLQYLINDMPFSFTMRLKIITIGRVRERYLREGISEFLKRLTPFAKVEIIELKDEGMKKEAGRLEKYLSPDTFVLDERGKELPSGEFAALLKNNAHLTFIIGGHEGVDESIKRKSKLLSLSRMTLLHEMARLILLEQIYRASMINSGRRYYQK